MPTVHFLVEDSVGVKDSKTTFMDGDNEKKNHGRKDTDTLAEKEVLLLGCSLSWTFFEEGT